MRDKLGCVLVSESLHGAPAVCAIHVWFATMPLSHHSTRDEVLTLYAEAMLAAQALEEAMVGLLALRQELAVFIRADRQPTSDEMDECGRLWEHLFALPAGELRKRLKLHGELGQEVDAAVRARNVLAHHYLRDHSGDLHRQLERSDMAEHLSLAAERFRALAARLEAERMAAMHDAGVTEDHVTTPDEARRMRYYDPTVDDAIAPHPFEDQ